MDTEDDLLRPPPLQPYRPVAAQLFVPAAAVEATIELLCRAGKRESGAFWYGRRTDAGAGTVAYVAAPRQRMFWGNYSVGPEALAEIVNGLEPEWRPLAQVHSHPGAGVEHSNYDDRVISSRRAVSLVFPYYGRLVQAFPTGIGVHEWQDGYWHLLEHPFAQHRVVVCDGAVKVEDYRWELPTKSQTGIF